LIIYKAKPIPKDIPTPTQTPNNFHEIEITYNNLGKLTAPFKILELGDIHPGNLTFDQEFYESALNTAERLNNVGIFKNGDVLELNTDSSPEAAMHEQIWPNQRQQDYIVEKNRKLANDGKILCWMGGGNHDDDRSKKKIGIPKSRDIAQILDVPYAPISAYHIIDWNGFRLIIYNNHGKGRTTGTKNGTRRKLLRESLIYPLADIICIGHTHRLEAGDLWTFEEIQHEVIIDYENMCMATQPKEVPHYLITGHFLGYLKSYGQKSGYPPIPAGYPIITLFPNGDYGVDFIWEPEWREKNSK